VNLTWFVQVHDIAAKAILSAEPKLNTEVKMKVVHRNNCFEVRRPATWFGFGVGGGFPANVSNVSPFAVAASHSCSMSSAT
jgi:hypothetical protein